PWTHQLAYGGFVGKNFGTIARSYAVANITAYSLTESPVGGFVGLNSGTIYESMSAGNVRGTDDLGGFVGSNDGAIRDSVSQVYVASSTNNDVGGFAGSQVSLGASIIRSMALGQVNSNDHAGGFIGNWF